MQDTSDDMLMALADNELSGPEAERLRAQIAADPVLLARFAVFSETRAAVQAAFAAGPVPDRLIRAIELAQAEPAASPKIAALWPKRAAAGWQLALAASLLLVVGAGSFLAGRSLSPASLLTDPALAAAQALSERITGDEAALASGGTARVLGSYRTDAGVCRLFELRLPADRSERAVVCRPLGGEWAVVAAVTAGEGEGYVTASVSAVTVIDQVLDDLGAGPALDSASEAALLAE